MKPSAPLLVVLMLISLAACSADSESTETSPDNSSAQVPAIIFLQYLNQQAPTLLCEQDPQIACLQMPGELCQASVKAAQERCGPKLLEQWPASFAETQENATRYAREYRNCMLQDWVTEFGLQEKRLAACGIDLD